MMYVLYVCTSLTNLTINYYIVTVSNYVSREERRNDRGLDLLPRHLLL
jgi:hypothetical protein